MDNTNTAAAVTAATITRAQVEAVRDHALTSLTGRAAGDLVIACDNALAEPFPGESGFEGSSTRTALYGRGEAARALAAIRHCDACEP